MTRSGLPISLAILLVAAGLRVGAIGPWGQTPTSRPWGQTPNPPQWGQTPSPSKRGQTPWPPPVQKVADIVPALSADAELKTFHLPPGYHAQLVASEPLVTDPIWVDFDADGRMYVLEMPGFAMDKTMADSREPIGRIAVLEDTNDDGRMDKRTVFMDGLVLPRALKVLTNGVLVGEPPNLWFAKDTDGDLKADTKELVRNDYGRLEGNLEHNANSLWWALDNWIYTSEHDWHLRLKNGKFEVQKTLSRGQWGVGMDDAGRIYRNVNTEALFADIVPASYFMRNPNIVRTRGLYEDLVDPNKTAIWPVRPTRGVNRGYRDELLRADGSAAYYTGVSSPMIYRGDRLPKQLQGNAFVVDSPTNLVHRLIVEDDGSGRISARDAYRKGEFLASTDERFRPVNLFSAPDGTIYVVDMYRGVVQDVQFQTEYLKDYIAKHELELPVGNGRIWRVVHDSTRRDRKPALSKETPAGLVAVLSHPNGWWRDTAQQLLVQRGDRSVVPALKQLALNAPDLRARLHALWTLDGLDAIDEDTVAQTLKHVSPDVRAASIRLSERWIGQSDDRLQAAVLQQMNNPNWTVRRQLAASLGALPEAQRLETLTTLLGRFGDDPITVDAAISGLKGQEAAALNGLLASKTEANQTLDPIEMLAGAATKAGDKTAVQQIIAAAADPTRAEAQRLALLRGLDAGLSGAARSTGGLVAATGAAAAAGAAAPGNAGGFGGRGRDDQTGGGRLFTEEPTALTGLTSGYGEIATLAKQIVARIAWPGKPAPAGPAAAPLTPQEQTRYAAGGEIYKNICIACHQPDGQGKEHVAPSLVGSKFALAPATVPARILLAGKEGTVGLMPPLNTLNDDQIAAVLTYVRREWGNTASAVDPATVKEVRGLTASRTRPWTEAELSRLLSGRGGG
jgi:mono/diheme cytochrome c family protein/glucose/arabinose dehydrogenase